MENLTEECCCKPQICTCTPNLYGKIDYSNPIMCGHTNFESMTKSSVQYIPEIQQKYERKRLKPLPHELTQQSVEVLQETLKTSNQNDFGYKHSDPAIERYSRAQPQDHLLFVTSVKEKFFNKPPKPLKPGSSTTKNAYPRHQLPDYITRKEGSSIEDTYCKVVGVGRDMQPQCRPEEPGYMKLLDPYLTTSRQYHVPFTPNQWNGIAKKNVLTIYDMIEPKIPKCKGFGVKDPPRLGPMFPAKGAPIYDKAKFKFVNKIFVFPRSSKIVPHKGGTSETKAQYIAPILSSNYYTHIYTSDVEYGEYLPDVSKMQVMSVPGMYESEYTLGFSKKQPIVAVVDQDKHKVQPHAKPCLQSRVQ